MPNLAIHLIADVILIAAVWGKKDAKEGAILAWQVFASNLIDLDHFLAEPIYDPARCGINFHPLHSWYMFPIYAIGSIYGRYKYFFWGVILHIILDTMDCYL